MYCIVALNNKQYFLNSKFERQVTSSQYCNVLSWAWTHIHQKNFVLFESSVSIKTALWSQNGVSKQCPMSSSFVFRNSNSFHGPPDDAGADWAAGSGVSGKNVNESRQKCASYEIFQFDKSFRATVVKPNSRFFYSFISSGGRPAPTTPSLNKVRLIFF